MKNKLGSYLKEVSISFLLNEKINMDKAKDFISKTIDLIEVQLVSLNENYLFPGFDLIAIIKESIIYFGYWYDEDLVRLHIFSCKNFDEQKIKILIDTYFSLKSKIKLEIIRNISIDKEIEELCR